MSRIHEGQGSAFWSLSFLVYIYDLERVIVADIGEFFDMKIDFSIVKEDRNREKTERKEQLRGTGE